MNCECLFNYDCRAVSSYLQSSPSILASDRFGTCRISHPWPDRWIRQQSHNVPPPSPSVIKADLLNPYCLCVRYNNIPRQISPLLFAHFGICIGVTIPWLNFFYYCLKKASVDFIFAFEKEKAKMMKHRRESTPVFIAFSHSTFWGEGVSVHRPFIVFMGSDFSQ